MLEDPNERAEVRARAQGVQQGVRCCGRAIGEQGVERRARDRFKCAEQGQQASATRRDVEKAG